jgi:hypothetical protein
VNNIDKLTLSRGALLTALFLVVLLYGTRLEIAFASEYGSSQEDIAISEITPDTEFSESSSKGDTLQGTVSQQNECQGNIVICQNILTKLICSERAVCIIGNLDPFLLVLPN